MKLIKTKVKKNPRISIRKLSDSARLKTTTIFNIMKNLNLHPYKIQIVPKLNEMDYGKRKKFAKEMLDLLENRGAIDDIFFSDEAHFHLGGYVNKQNMRYWSEKNPKELHEMKMHVEKSQFGVRFLPKKLLFHIFIDKV